MYPNLYGNRWNDPQQRIVISVWSAIFVFKSSVSFKLRTIENELCIYGILNIILSFEN